VVRCFRAACLEVRQVSTNKVIYGCAMMEFYKCKILVIPGAQPGRAKKTECLCLRSDRYPVSCLGQHSGARKTQHPAGPETMQKEKTGPSSFASVRNGFTNNALR
jgi:hypothetical protein